MNTLKTASKILGLFEPGDRRKALGLLSLMIISGLIETGGIVSIMPFMAVVSTVDAVDQVTWVATVHGWLGGGDVHRFLLELGVITAVTVVASNCLSALTSRAIFRFTFGHGYRLGRRLLASYLFQPYSFFLEHNTVELGRNVLDEAPRVVEHVIFPAMQIVAKSVSVGLIILLLLVVDARLALVVLGIFGGAYVVLHRVVQRQILRMREVAGQSRTAMARSAMEALSGVKELKMLGRESDCLETYAAPASAFAKAEAGTLSLVTTPRYLLEAMIYSGVVVIVLFLLGHGRAAYDALPLLAMYSFAGYRLLPALQVLHVHLSTIKYYAPSLMLVERHLTSVANVRSDKLQPDALPLNESIDLDHVRFSYRHKPDEILSDITVRIPAGTVFGIVGATGSGKSTLLDIIVGLLPPTAGRISIDGQLLSADRIRPWQSNIGYVPQQIYLSDSTIAENIAFGAPSSEIDMDRVVAAAKAAHVHEFVSEWPSRYNTLVGERGTRLSGGQRQRIGIARALYRNPAVLVFDEATSALDNLTELAVMEALQTLMGIKTIILVTHRLTSLRLCQQIIVLENGRVIDQGAHHELAARSRLFGYDKALTAGDDAASASASTTDAGEAERRFG